VMEGAKDVFIRWLVSKDDDALNFYLRLFTVKSGGHTPYHKHSYEHEVFVLDGEGIVVIDGVEHKLRNGFVVTVPSDIMHQFRNSSDSDFRFLCIIPENSLNR
ncbi:MAG: cupin domain-containing protein, partial [Deltaproteobacteria bacterium]|nr:cupin domain-containing protein [Deltaproteobacteria bacterium]